jgi:hypothetical protein
MDVDFIHVFRNTSVYIPLRRHGVQQFITQSSRIRCLVVPPSSLRSLSANSAQILTSQYIFHGVRKLLRSLLHVHMQQLATTLFQQLSSSHCPSLHATAM